MKRSYEKVLYTRLITGCQECPETDKYYCPAWAGGNICYRTGTAKDQWGFVGRKNTKYFKKGGFPNWCPLLKSKEKK